MQKQSIELLLSVLFVLALSLLVSITHKNLQTQSYNNAQLKIQYDVMNL